jgi:hypothetical protein
MSNIAAYLVKDALKDGNEVTIRAMRPDDKERLVEAFFISSLRPSYAPFT